MSRIIAVKITYPKECCECGRMIGINEWAQARGEEGFACAEECSKEKAGDVWQQPMSPYQDRRKEP